ncbi:LysR family transcriptional regulator [Microbacterium sp. 10M-3C3]|jgi:DNA-binding transcriptional LysR family regulator|uniref:LysR family transcriptional regulator n=1 Tax=Microbacterium sp. 10M-3C3 TaxID=2483401 RepID=UPI000F62F550|nr:LysR family transcriptional regulator [Microbacterium sp. 10M-3C3]
MELHQLRYVLAVVDTGSFTAAAERVRVAQSGVSSQVQKLERELGVTIFDRSSRRVSLTPDGQRLLPALRAAVAAADDVHDRAAELRGLVTGGLRIGTVTGLVLPALFDAISGLHADHPGLELSVREGLSDQLVTDVRRGDLDIAIAAWALHPPEGLETAVLVDDALVAVVSADHPWATRRVVRPADIAAADVIALSRGAAARVALDAMLGRAGASATPRWEVATPALLETLTARGLGVGVASETTVSGAEGLVRLRIDDPRARSQFGIVWRPGPGAAARALLQLLLPSREE